MMFAPFIFNYCGRIQTVGLQERHALLGPSKLSESFLLCVYDLKKPQTMAHNPVLPPKKKAIEPTHSLNQIPPEFWFNGFWFILPPGSISPDPHTAEWHRHIHTLKARHHRRYAWWFRWHRSHNHRRGTAHSESWTKRSATAGHDVSMAIVGINYHHLNLWCRKITAKKMPPNERIFDPRKSTLVVLSWTKYLPMNDKKSFDPADLSTTGPPSQARRRVRGRSRACIRHRP